MTDYKNELRSVLYDFLGDYKDKRYLSEGNTDQALAAIREHFLKEALEMIDSTPKLILKGKFEDDMGLFGDYIEVAELRNKFNDKYKED